MGKISKLPQQVVQFEGVMKEIGQGGLRAPCVLAMRSLAIVITIVQSFFHSLFLFSPSFAFDPIRGNSHV